MTSGVRPYATAEVAIRTQISPAPGAKRLFSKKALADFLKGVAKLTVIGSVIAALLWPQRHRLDALVSTDPAALLPQVQGRLAAKPFAHQFEPFAVQDST